MRSLTMYVLSGLNTRTSSHRYGFIDSSSEKVGPRLDPGQSSGITGGALVALTLPKHGLYPLVAPTRPLIRGDRPIDSPCAKATEQETGTVLLRLIGRLRDEKMHALYDVSCKMIKVF